MLGEPRHHASTRRRLPLQPQCHTRAQPRQALPAPRRTMSYARAASSSVRERGRIGAAAAGPVLPSAAIMPLRLPEGSDAISGCTGRPASWSLRADTSARSVATSDACAGGGQQQQRARCGVEMRGSACGARLFCVGMQAREESGQPGHAAQQLLLLLPRTRAAAAAGGQAVFRALAGRGRCCCAGTQHGTPASQPQSAGPLPDARSTTAHTLGIGRPDSNMAASCASF